MKCMEKVRTCDADIKKPAMLSAQDRDIRFGEDSKETPEEYVGL